MKPERQLPEGVPDIARNPVKYIEWVIACMMMIGAFYIGGPFFQPNAGGSSTSTGSAIGATFLTRVTLETFAVLYGAPGLMLAYGLVKDKRNWRRHGLFLSSSALTFTVCLILAVNGLRPLTWLAPLAIGLIAGIIWLRIKWEDNSGYGGH